MAKTQRQKHVKPCADTHWFKFDFECTAACVAFVLSFRMVLREHWKLVHKTEVVTKTKRKRGRTAKTLALWYEYHVKARAEDKPLLKYSGCGHTVYTDLEFRKTCWKRQGSGASACMRERRLKLNVPSIDVEIVIAPASARRRGNTTQEKQMRPPSDKAPQGLRTCLCVSRSGQTKRSSREVLQPHRLWGGSVAELAVSFLVP